MASEEEERLKKDILLHGPISYPPVYFAHLSEKTRAFLSSISEEDIQRMEALLDLAKDTEVTQLKELVEVMNNAKVVRRFGKWMVITAFTLFIGAYNLYEPIARFLAWMRGQ